MSMAAVGSAATILVVTRVCRRCKGCRGLGGLRRLSGGGYGDLLEVEESVVVEDYGHR